MQKTDFAFEAIVHDDASQDGTKDVIREYAKKYPDIIKPIIEKENLYSKNDGSLLRIVESHLRGEYVAICEGDDYWIDPFKLQKQVDFLDCNPEYVLVYSDCVVVDENENQLKALKPKHYEGHCFKHLLLKGNFIVTASVCYRRNADCGRLEFINSFPFKLKMGDKPQWYYLSQKGLFKYQNKTFVAYRVLKESASHSNDIKKVLDFAENGEKIALYVNDYFNARIPENKIRKVYARGRLRNILKMDTDDYKLQSIETFKKYPSLILTPKLLILIFLRYFFNIIR